MVHNSDGQYPLPNLPLELITTIIHLLPRADIQSCSLVHSDWMSICHSILFRTAKIGLQKDIEHLNHLFNQSPHLLCAIREIEIKQKPLTNLTLGVTSGDCMSQTRLWSQLASNSNIHKLWLANFWSWETFHDRLVNHFANIEELVLSDFFFKDQETVSSVLTRLPRLGTLTMYGVFTERQDPRLTVTTSYPLRLSRLHTLNILVSRNPQIVLSALLHPPVHYVLHNLCLHLRDPERLEGENPQYYQQRVDGCNEMLARLITTHGRNLKNLRLGPCKSESIVLSESSISSKALSDLETDDPDHLLESNCFTDLENLETLTFLKSQNTDLRALGHPLDIAVPKVTAVVSDMLRETRRTLLLHSIFIFVEVSPGGGSAIHQNINWEFMDLTFSNSRLSHLRNIMFQCQCSGVVVEAESTSILPADQVTEFESFISTKLPLAAERGALKFNRF